MRSLLSSALIAVVAMAVLPGVPQPAHAGAGVLRCAMPDGSHVYTNKACSAFGATSAPMSGEVLNRIQRDQRYEASLTGTPVEAGAETNATIAPVSARRSVGGGCARSPQQLAMDLQAAVALGDVNRVAESYHWNGMRNAAAQRIMLRLEQLASRSIVSVEYFDAQIGGLGGGLADAGAGLSDGGAGMLQAMVSTGDGTQVVDFSVQRDEGCYFVRY